jgi:EAL domain-containing protein (putative c-di-GMP-specific phosphodiesterase class I)/GGDEF domain-containing protein
MFSGPSQILLIDGNPRALAEIVAPLTGRGYRVTHRGDARGGLEEIYRKAPEMILVRRDLPDMDGIHFCSEIKNDIVLRHIPVIVLDPDGLLPDEIAAAESGAEDCLIGPVDTEELDVRIRQVFHVGSLGINYHPVSGLPGYSSAYRRIREVLERQSTFALCFLDIQGFRSFNRRFGYEKGDRILGATARLISRVLHSRQRCLDFFGHLSSDDFVLITEAEGVETLCSEIVEQFEWRMPELLGTLPREPDPQSLFGELPCRGGERHPESLSLSIAILTNEDGSLRHPAQAIEQGTELLAYARQERKSRWVRQKPKEKPAGFPWVSGPPELEKFSGQGAGGFRKGQLGRMTEQVKRFHEILRDHEIETFFQPIVYVESGELFGYEALLRGPRGTHFESPVMLFSMARRMDMERELDLLSLRKLREAAAGARMRGGTEKIFFNLCPESFFSPRFLEAWETVAGDLRPERMVLEVTRKRRIQEFSCFRASIQQLRTKGFQVAVDDARAGTLSLRTILELLPDYIKVDISITRNIHQDPARQRLFRQLHSFCKLRNVKLISEGVEQQKERDFLLENGAELAQGYYYSEPLQHSVM